MIRDQSVIDMKLEQADNLFLFLDYDGTLADFAPNPDIVEPDSEVIELLKLLIANEHIQVAIISGRRLSHLRKLIPLPALTLAGTYGLEMRMQDGEIVIPLINEDIRTQLDILKTKWEDLIQGEEGFYLEDKKWTIAIHAKYAKEQKAKTVLNFASSIAEKILTKEIFQIKPGQKFLEAGPIQANKGICLEYLLNKYPHTDELMIYMGDDDKDEEAFAVIQSRGGLAIRVCSNVINKPIEDWRLDNTQAARDWLRSLTNYFT